MLKVKKQRNKPNLKKQLSQRYRLNQRKKLNQKRQLNQRRQQRSLTTILTLGMSMSSIRKMDTQSEEISIGLSNSMLHGVATVRNLLQHG